MSEQRNDKQRMNYGDLHKCPPWFMYTLIGVVVVMHALNVNSFHLMSQFGPPILEECREASPLMAGLTTSVTTMLPIIGRSLDRSLSR